jgi:bile acid:Na+ symporter, BASS family
MFTESLKVLDHVRLNFSDQGVVLMNITIAFIMFGVALDMKIENFKKLFANPKAMIVGAISQIILVPSLTFLLILIIKPSPSIAFGMILVAACPGGNISNFITSLAKGNTTLAVSLTALSTLLAVFTVPFNFAFWGGLYANTSPYLRPIHIDAFQMFKTVVLLLGIPVVAGILFSKYYPKITEKIFKPIRIASIFAFFGFVVGAFAANFEHFLNYIQLIFIIVLIHNAMALLSGFLFASAMRLQPIDRRTISIESGIHNSGLGLALIFNPKIFPTDLGLGGMAFIAAWWGIWHIISGMGIATFWSWKTKREKNGETAV